MTDRPGIVTVSHWTRVQDGSTKLSFWSHRWSVVSAETFAKAFGFKGSRIRSSEGWCLIAGPETDPWIVIPGCQVKVLGRRDPCGGVVSTASLTDRIERFARARGEVHAGEVVAAFPSRSSHSARATLVRLFCAGRLAREKRQFQGRLRFVYRSVAAAGGRS